MAINLPPKSDESFLQRQLREIIVNKQDFEKIIKIKEGVYNEVKSWSSLKLIFLNYVAHVYASIMKNQRYYHDKYFYVDLFAGSGIGKVTDNKNDLIFGSPLLIATQNKFVKMYFCDINNDYIKALEERLKGLNIPENKFSVYSEDCNSATDKIISEVKSGHSLIFIDPLGMEIKWKTMEKILQLNADIIINFQTPSIPRARQKNNIGTVMTDFFKNKEDVERIYQTAIHEGTLGERLLHLYIKDIQDTWLKYKDSLIVEKIPIKKGDNRFYYDLIFLTRKTANGSPWMQTIKNAGDAIERLDSKIVQQVLNVLNGRQETIRMTLLKKLSGFLPTKKSS